VEYAWSWCPVSVEVESGLACPIDEALWTELWEEAGLTGAAPAYELGSDATALIEPRFEADSAERLCEAIAALGAAGEPARIACVDGFEASVVLRARAGGDEEIAIKSLPFAEEGTPAEARNHNPGPLGSILVRGTDAEEPVSDGTLRAERDYELRVELDEALSEELPEPEAERETLVLSWFVTPGKVSKLDDDDDDDGPGLFDDDTQRTLYVPGLSAFEKLLENGWKVPRSEARDAELVLVLRDERGGVAWRRERFQLVGE
jgi:hypothetical protein